MHSDRRAGEHRDAIEAEDVAARPEQGPIALLGKDREPFISAVRDAGGTLEPLSGTTRGLVFLDVQRTDVLEQALEDHPGISWVQLPWAGVDSFARVLARYADEPKPLWTSAKGAYAEPVAEHALALTLATMRMLADKARSTSWATRKQGISLFGRHVVIVGAGGIASSLIDLLAPFGTTITVVRRSAGALPGAHRTVRSEELDAVLPDADALVLAAASTGETAHLIGAAQLELLKPTAVLVNIARGALVDPVALNAALRAGALWGAGLDVTEPEPLPDGDPLWTAPRCVITSHCADTPEMVEPLLAGRVGRNVRAFLGDGRFVGVVDPGAGY